MSGAKINGTPCREVTIKLDCSRHPEKIPRFKVDDPPGFEIWNVEPSGTRKDTRKILADELAKYLEDTRNQDNAMNDYIKKTYDVSSEKMGAMSANEFETLFEKTVGSSKSGGDKSAVLPIHHLRPHWAGGSDDGSNLTPLDYKDHTAADQPHKVHGWWGDKLKEQQETLREQLKKCDQKRSQAGNQSRSKSKGSAQKAQQKKMEDLMTNANKQTKTLTEVTITTLARKLRKFDPPATLEVEMTCPQAVVKK